MSVVSCFRFWSVRLTSHVSRKWESSLIVCPELSRGKCSLPACDNGAYEIFTGQIYTKRVGFFKTLVHISWALLCSCKWLCYLWCHIPWSPWANGPGRGLSSPILDRWGSSHRPAWPRTSDGTCTTATTQAGIVKKQKQKHFFFLANTHILHTDLAHDEKFLSFDHGLFHHGLDTFSHLYLVQVDKCSVNVTVTSSNGCLYRCGHLARLRLVKSKHRQEEMKNKFAKRLKRNKTSAFNTHLK